MAIITTLMNPLSTTSTTTATRSASTNAATMINRDIDEQLCGCKRPLHYSSTQLEEPQQEQPLKKQRTITPAPKRAAKKQVSFGHEYVHEVDRISEVDAPYVWYSAQEFIHSRRCDGHWVNFYTHCDESYKQQLFKVLGAACGKMAPTKEPLVALAASECRGLEREMTPCFRQRKKQVVTNVLQSQSALMAWKDNKPDISTAEAAALHNKGADVLAAHYHKLALPATRFARLLAQGDAIIAASSQR